MQLGRITKIDRFDPMLTVEDAAELLHLPVSLVREFIQKHKLSFVPVKAGSPRGISLKAVNRLQERMHH